MEKFLKDINFKDLKGQKATLVEMATKSKGKEKDALESIICILDALQDEAVDNYGYKEEEVFDLEP
jgi:hypothetical protein